MKKRTAFVLLGVALFFGLGWVWMTHRPILVALAVVALCASLALLSALLAL
ncbi:MAG TPA: hypothetical protein VKV40_18580 [Ktedonobacteraceae bacterium]|nr:hypothetical protein [Ktedonobacteraceae bacterium]